MASFIKLPEKVCKKINFKNPIPKKKRKRNKNRLAGEATDAPTATKFPPTKLLPLASPAPVDLQPAEFNVEIVQQLATQGEKPEAIAMKLGVSVNIVKPLCDSLSNFENGRPSTRKILNRHLFIINNCVEQAQNEYASNPTDKNSHALTSLIQSSQGLLRGLGELEANYTWAKEIDKLVMRPLMKEPLSFLTTELSDLLSYPLIQNDPTLNKILSGRMKQMLLTLADFYRKLYVERLNELANYLQLPDEDKVKLIPRFKPGASS